MEDQLDHRRLIEAALFMSQNAMGINDLANATGIMSPGHIETLIKGLIEEYRTRDTALQVLEIGGKYMFTLKEPYASKVSGLAIGPDLSKGALRLLAYVSKNDGVVQSELVKIFGETTYAYVKELVEKEFVETKRSGRSKKVSTTLKFKEYFNV